MQQASTETEHGTGYAMADGEAPLSIGARVARWFGRARTEPAEYGLYRAVVAQARMPVFYSDHAVPDSVDGRFDLITLHAFLVMRRLKAAGPAGQALSQALFDTMFADMDRSLREMGVGDLGVGKRVRTMAEAFMGRVSAYENGLAASGDAELIGAVSRNLYRGDMTAERHGQALAAYIRHQATAMDGLADDDLLAGRLVFGPPSFGQPA